MAAYLSCWEPSLGLDPTSPDFLDRAGQYIEAHAPPTKAILVFADALLARFPDAMRDDIETIWSAGPFKDFLSGKIAYIGVRWTYYRHAARFIRLTATAHSLDFFDWQIEEYIPAPRPS